MKFFGSKKNSSTYITGFLLRQEEGVVFVLQTNEQAKTSVIVDHRNFTFSNSWENLKYDIDELLNSLEVMHKIKLSESIFFLFSHLVDKNAGDVQESYKGILEEVSKENHLDVIGTVDFDDVLARYLRRSKDMNDVVLIELDISAISMYVYEQGSLVYSDSVAKTENISSDVDELLRNHSGDLLPMNVVLYDSTSMESETSDLLTHAWDTKKFGGKPELMIIPFEEHLVAMQEAINKTKFGVEGTVDASVVSPVVEVQPQTEPEEPDEDGKDESEAKSSDVQFVSKNMKSAPVDGFVIGEDILGEPQSKHSQDVPQFATQAAVPLNEFIVAPTIQTSSFESQGISTVSFVDKLKSMIQLPGMKFSVSHFKKLIAILIIFGLIGGGVTASLYYLHSAKVVIKYQPKEIKKKITLPDTIKIAKETNEFTVDASVKATGSKNIGEKAEGTVTIYNANDSEKVLSAGTKLTVDGLEFTLNEKVSIEAASSTITDEDNILTTTSKKDASITASEIGSKFNIKKDSKLSIEGFSSNELFARTKNALTGGSEKEVQTASKEDFTKLDKEIQKQLNDKIEDFLKKEGAGKKILRDLTEKEITKETYSKELSEEAKQIDAEVTADVSYYSYRDEDFKQFIREKLKSDVPENYILNDENIEFKVLSVSKDEDTGDIKIVLEASATPAFDIDIEQLKTDLVFDRTNTIKSTLKDQYKADGFELILSSPIPFYKAFMPVFKKNIDIELESL